MAAERIFPAGTRVDGLDLSGVRLHAATLQGARLTDAELVGARITGEIDGLVVNGVDVEPLVRAELDRRHPELAMLRASDVETLRQGWSILEGRWAETTARATRLPEARLCERVDGEWSYLETLRHLVLATDCWIARGIHGVLRPYHAWGLPWSGMAAERARRIGVDPDANPNLDEVLQMREERQASVGSTLRALSDAGLAEVRRLPDDGGYPIGEHSVLQCLHVLLNEEWQHLRYATRDLDALDPEGGTPDAPLPLP